MTEQKIESIPGVNWEKDRKTWRVHIVRDGKKIYLGRRKVFAEAKELRMNAEAGIMPAEEDKKRRLFDKMARIRLRAVWRELLSDPHRWESFDHFVSTVDDRPAENWRLVAIDTALAIGPGNCKWEAPEFDRTTKEGRNAYYRMHRSENPDVYRNGELRRNFGITLGDYQAKMLEQSGVCAICHRPETAIRMNKLLPLAVDHNHTTGAVRGLLCTACNIGIGSLCESPELLRSAITYLEKWNKPDD